jgi:hypothetical protein
MMPPITRDVPVTREKLHYHETLLQSSPYLRLSKDLTPYLCYPSHKEIVLDNEISKWQTLKIPIPAASNWALRNFAPSGTDLLVYFIRTSPG